MTKINRTPADKKPYNLFGTLAWEECEGGVRIAALQEKAFSVTIPREIEGMPVVALGNGCFVGQETLEEIILPDTLREVATSPLRAVGRCGCWTSPIRWRCWAPT